MKLVSTQHSIVDSEEKCSRLLEKLPSVKKAALDTESTGAHRQLARPVSLQLHWGERPYFVPEKYLHRLKPWFDSKPLGIFYGAKSDMYWLHNVGLEWKGPVHDVLVIDYMCDENVKVSSSGGNWESSLKQRHADIFGHEPRKGYAEEFGNRGADEVIAEEGYERLAAYGCADATETWELYLERVAKLQQQHWIESDNMFDHFLEYGAPFTKVLYNMERRGCYIDRDFLEELDGRAIGMLEEVEREFYVTAREAAGDEKMDKEFTNKLLGSWQQLGKLFYDVLGYPEQFKMTKNKKTGLTEKKRTTDEDALDTLAEMGYPLPSILVKRRQISKLHGTYVLGILKRLWKHRIHTEFQQAFTKTGRLSSRDPNLQNIPRPQNDPFGLRAAFIPTPGMMMLSLDYSQIEVRIAAHLSGDELLIAACQASDIYSEMAKLLFPGKPDGFWVVGPDGKPLGKEAGILRQTVKAIVLGILFGKQAKSIGLELGISERKAQQFIDQFFLRFKKMYAYMESLKKQVRKLGFVRTLTGRYRNIPEIKSPNKWIRLHAERMALNSPVQGSAFDMMQKAMMVIEDSGVCKEFGGYMILSVHDELLFEFPKDKNQATIKEAEKKIREMMEHPFSQDLSVPVVVSGSIGMSWEDCK